MKKGVVPIDRERTFLIHELFFSTTDHKGIIESGNDVFVRISGHSAGQLIGSPHNIIRHPDMPRAAFKLLWDYLKAGKTFAAYVKNMAADGSYYWVMALVVPYRKGYISVRFKPSGPYFAAAKDVYAEMLAIENADGNEKNNDWRAQMQLSAERMLEILRAKGFESYDAFMQTAIASEMTIRRAALAKSESWREIHNFTAVAARANEKLQKTAEICAGVEQQLDDLFSHVGSFLDLIAKLNQRSHSLDNLSKEIKTVSLNGVIVSNRLGEAARGLSVVTEALTRTAGDSTEAISKISAQLSSMSRLMHEMAFAITSAKLQVEMTLFFAHEILHGEDSGGANLDAETTTRIFHDIESLTETLAQSVAKVLKTLPESSETTTNLIRLKGNLQDSLRQLSRIRITGKVQAAYIAEAGYFHNLFDNVYGQLDNAAGELQELSDAILILKKQLPHMAHTGTTVQSALCSLA